MQFIDPFEGLADGSNPREAMEEAEAAAGQGDAVMGAQADFVSKLLAYCLTGSDLQAIGTKALFAASKIRPDIFPAAQLSAMMPPGALRALEKDWESTFGGATPGGARRR